MTALFFIAQGPELGRGRRVDLAALAQRFAEPDDVPPARAPRRPAVRFALLTLILLGSVGDMVFVARPALLSPAVGVGRSSQAVAPSAPEQA